MICEDCINKEVCKFRKKIEEYFEKGFHYGNITVPEPLEVNITCKFKKIAEPPPSYTIYGTDSTTWAPNITYTGIN